MSQTQDMAPHPITLYKHRADLPLHYPLIRNLTLEYTATHFNVLGQTRSGKSFPDLPHTPANVQLHKTNMVVVYRKLGRKCSRDLWCANHLRYPLAHSCFYRSMNEIVIIKWYYPLNSCHVEIEITFKCICKTIYLNGSKFRRFTVYLLALWVNDYDYEFIITMWVSIIVFSGVLGSRLTLSISPQFL